MTDVDQQHELQSRAGVYWMLAKLWSGEPDSETFEHLANPELSEVLSEFGVRFQSNPDEDYLESLAVDYCQLFIGPQNQTPLSQSAFQESTIHGVALDNTRQFFELLSPNLQQQFSESERENLDFVGAQLKLMSVFLFAAASCESPETFEKHHEISTCFFRDHVYWLKGALKLARDKANTDFFENLFKLTDDFLNSEFEELFAGLSASNDALNR